MKLLSIQNQRQRLTDWLETRWVNPDYKGWLLGVLSLFFFLAASNTLAGWLYVMSGISVALLAIAAYLTRRSLRDLKLHRSSIPAVSVGQSLRLELTVHNASRTAKSLLQLRDPLPVSLGGIEEGAIALIAPGQDHHYTYSRLAQVRGYYRWESLILRSGAPLGLFWYRRSLSAKAKAIVYPHIIPLDHCPLVDVLGQERNPNLQQVQRSKAAPEGLTRALRPYRWGDPIRMVHWRTSARYGELRVRELETLQAGQEIILAIDSAAPWHPLADWNPDGGISVGPGQINTFEQAVTALASLYRYASRRQERVQVWTARSGMVSGDRRILQTLAAVQPSEGLPHESHPGEDLPREARASETSPATDLPRQPIIWFTQNPETLAQLPHGSRWLLWPKALSGRSAVGNLSTTAAAGLTSGLTISPTEPLYQQLQAQLNRQPSSLTQ